MISEFVLRIINNEGTWDFYPAMQYILFKYGYTGTFDVYF